MHEDINLNLKNTEQPIEVEKKELRERVPAINTVRVAIFHRGRFLLLQKNKNSRNPGAIEFPGGQLNQMAGEEPTEDELKSEAIREVWEETRIDISNYPLENLGSHEVFFKSKNKDNRRIVHLFLVRIPDENDSDIKINQTENAKGESEDNHERMFKLTPDELVHSATTLEKNEMRDDELYEIPLTRNSRRIKELLEAIKSDPPIEL